MATLEEARKCPKCEQPGREVTTRSIPRSRDRLLTLRCENDRCQWYNTTWVVQVRPDGSVPDPDTRPRFKDYPERSAGGLEIARNMDQLERLLEAQKRPGGAEIG